MFILRPLQNIIYPYFMDDETDSEGFPTIKCCFYFILPPLLLLWGGVIGYYANRTKCNAKLYWCEIFEYLTNTKPLKSKKDSMH